ncbi:hypothetical protein F5Y13DRAFT_158360 [Hypoxylon sp. FL1857]|nr:hypothetical protein F5Y13DRAFT_158360 [Hypoxylon sp. FL1857]
MGCSVSIAAQAVFLFSFSFRASTLKRGMNRALRTKRPRLKLDGQRVGQKKSKGGGRDDQFPNSFYRYQFWKRRGWG